MKIKSIVLIITFFLMIFSQTMYTKYILFTIIPLFLFLWLRNTNISKLSMNNIYPLFIITIIGLISGLLSIDKYDIYYFTRDFLYFIQAPLYILLGFLLYNEIKDYKKILQVIIVSTFLITVYKLIPLILKPQLIFDIGLDARYEYNFSNTLAITTVVILLYTRKNKYKLLNNYIELSIMLVSFFSILISFSRITYLMLILLFIIPYIVKTTLLLRYHLLSTILVFFFIFGGVFMKSFTGGDQGNSFESKIFHSLNEIVISKYNTLKEINNNWRGFEANMGLEKYYQSSPLEYLFGQGFGAVVITPTWIFKNSDVDNLDVIPMFHNGYITILLKSGLIGLILYFVWLYYLLKTANKFKKINNTEEERIIILLIQAIVILFFFYTFVIHGIFQTNPPFIMLILLGYSIQALVVIKKLADSNILLKDKYEK